MGLNNLIKAFLPKDKVFFSLFEEIGHNLEGMAVDFQAAMEEMDYNKRNAKLAALEDWEHKNDSVTHRVFVELGQNFITPFDREDIHYLATSLDDIADYIYTSAKKIIIYNVAEPDDFMRNLAKVVHESTIVLAKAVY